MAAELLAHRREDPIAEVALATGREAFEEGGGEDVGRHRLVDGRQGRPPALARIRDPPREALQLRITVQGVSREVEQPQGDHAAAPPQLGDLAGVDLVLVVLGIGERGRLRIGLGSRVEPDVGLESTSWSTTRLSSRLWARL